MKKKINYCFIDTEDKQNMKMKMAKQSTCDTILKDKILQSHAQTLLLSLLFITHFQYFP